MKVNGPCFNCPDRHIGCHGKCERYAAWKEERNMIYQNRSYDLQRYKRVDPGFHMKLRSQVVARKGDRKRGRNGDEL